MEHTINVIAVEGLRVLFLLGLPVAISLGITGVLVSALQAATAMSDSAGSYAVKILVLVAVLYFLFPLITRSIMTLTELAFT